MLDGNDLNILSSSQNENQSLWLHPKISNGKGVIFEAVYLTEFNQSPQTKIQLLGQHYQVLKLNPPTNASGRIIRGGSIDLADLDTGLVMSLADSEGFNGDSRWPVVLGWEDGELKKVIVYMGGYFYDIEDDESTISLFNSDERVLARFSDLDAAPKFELITKEHEVKKNT